MWDSLGNLFVRTQDNDDEALQVAALQRSPTFVRARTSVFRSCGGEFTLVDVSKLDDDEKKIVLDRLVSTVNANPGLFFDRIRRRFDNIKRGGWLIMHHVVALIAERQGGTCTNRQLSQLLSVMYPYVQGLMQNYYRAGGLIGSSLSIPTG
ncbi:hypothetical protein Hanom_Chr01g00091161 [Helianthus anomalus]